MLQVINLGKRYGAAEVFSSVSFAIRPGDRVGLVGANGSGKSTLLRCLAGVEQPDEGSVVHETGLRIGLLSQGLDPERTIGEILDAARREWVEAERQLQATAEALADAADVDEALAAYDAALARFEALGGYDREQRRAAVLDGLGLGDLDPATPVHQLSGGQQTRLGLAALLVAEPDLLLLDEPTNHLDAEALEWLEEFVVRFPGAILVVSHDREFLNRTVSRILFLDAETRTVRSYPGNYHDFAEARDLEYAQQLEAWKLQQEYVRRVQADVSRMKSEARSLEQSTTPRQPGLRKLARRKAAVAKTREHKLQRFLESDERVEKPRPTWGLNIDFGTPPPGGRQVVTLEVVSFAYPGQPPLFADVSFDVGYGERVALIGPNGAGKSTLLRLIEGTLRPTAGEVRRGAGVRVGTLSQDQRGLDWDRSVLDNVLAVRPMHETDARNFLHFFLFGGDSVFRAVGDCSFGERTRLQLAVLILEGCNLLLLDEPLNHLDIEGREHFEAALDTFAGTVITVTHDRAFLRSFPERIIEVRDSGVTLFPGGYDDYLARRERGPAGGGVDGCHGTQ